LTIVVLYLLVRLALQFVHSLLYTVTITLNCTVMATSLRALEI